MDRQLGIDLQRVRYDLELDEDTLAGLAELPVKIIKKAEKFSILPEEARKKIYIALLNASSRRLKIPVSSDYSAEEARAVFFMVFPQYFPIREVSDREPENEADLAEQILDTLYYIVGIVLKSLMGDIGLKGWDDLTDYLYDYCDNIEPAPEEQFVQISCYRSDRNVSTEFYFRMSRLTESIPEISELAQSLMRFLKPESFEVEDLIYLQNKSDGKFRVIAYKLKHKLLTWSKDRPSPVVRNLNLWFQFAGKEDCTLTVSSYPQFFNGVRMEVATSKRLAEGIRPQTSAAPAARRRRKAGGRLRE